jgi:hypothetical protein
MATATVAISAALNGMRVTLRAPGPAVKGCEPAGLVWGKAARENESAAFSESAWVPRNSLVRPVVKFLYGGDCLLYRVADHLFRGIFADATVGEKQCFGDERMNDGVDPQTGALHLLDGAFQKFKSNVAHGIRENASPLPATARGLVTCVALGGMCVENPRWLRPRSTGDPTADSETQSPSRHSDMVAGTRAVLDHHAFSTTVSDTCLRMQGVRKN